MPIALCIPFPLFALCDDMLAMLVCGTCWLSMHFYSLAYMSMHESCLLVCHPCLNTMKLWTFDSNLHLTLADTNFFLLSCLFVFSFVCLLSYFFSCRVYHAYLLYASFTCSLRLFPSIACLLVSCLCFCMYTHEARMLGARCKQKEWRCEPVDIRQAVMFSRFRSLASPIWLCTL